MEVEKLKEVHEAIRKVLIDYDCEECGDCIIDEISNAVGIPTTTVYYEEEFININRDTMEKTNRLIAEFMGLKEHKGSYYLPLYNSGDWVPDVELDYHTSWDWLMPVIEKCLVGEAEQSEEMSNTTIKNIYEGICSQDISFAYKSVVKFIKGQEVNN